MFIQATSSQDRAEQVPKSMAAGWLVPSAASVAGSVLGSQSTSLNTKGTWWAVLLVQWDEGFQGWLHEVVWA